MNLLFYSFSFVSYESLNPFARAKSCISFFFCSFSFSSLIRSFSASFSESSSSSSSDSFSDLSSESTNSSYSSSSSASSFFFLGVDIRLSKFPTMGAVFLTVIEPTTLSFLKVLPTIIALLAADPLDYCSNIASTMLVEF
jgi:hypothetical protein